MTVSVKDSPDGSLQLPSFIIFDDSTEFEAWIKIQTDDVENVGEYRLDVREVDQTSGFVRVTSITINIFEAFIAI